MGVRLTKSSSQLPSLIPYIYWTYKEIGTTTLLIDPRGKTVCGVYREVMINHCPRDTTPSEALLAGMHYYGIMFNMPHATAGSKRSAMGEMKVTMSPQLKCDIIVHYGESLIRYTAHTNALRHSTIALTMVTLGVLLRRLLGNL